MDEESSERQQIEAEEQEHAASQSDSDSDSTAGFIGAREQEENTEQEKRGQELEDVKLQITAYLTHAPPLHPRR